MRRRRRRQEALNSSESFLPTPRHSDLSSSNPGSITTSTSADTYTASHSSGMNQFNMSEVPVPTSAPFGSQPYVISPRSIGNRKSVPYLDVAISRPGSKAVASLDPIQKTTDPFADADTSTMLEPLRNPFDDPEGPGMALDVSQLLVLPGSPHAEKRISGTSVNSFSSTGAPKEVCNFCFDNEMINIALSTTVWYRHLINDSRTNLSFRLLLWCGTLFRGLVVTNTSRCTCSSCGCIRLFIHRYVTSAQHGLSA